MARERRIESLSESKIKRACTRARARESVRKGKSKSESKTVREMRAETQGV